MRVIYSLILLLFSFVAHGQIQSNSFSLYSAQVKDSFLITLSHIGPLDTTKSLTSVYYLDANIKSGNKLRELLSDSAYGRHVINTLFVGVGYKGDNIARRRRDFIPPVYDSNASVPTKPDYGQADKFYAFLTHELIPFIDSNYITNGRRTLIGHSFGGLFVLYALFQYKPWFQNYIALSPSLWVNHKDIFNYEAAYHEKASVLQAYLYLSAGARENMNHVLRTTRQMKKVLEQRNYTGLQIKYEEHKAKGHHSHVPISLAHILQQTAF